MLRSLRTLSGCALLVLLLSGVRVFAQLITADLLGTVTDSAGAVIPNAKITVVNTATSEARNSQTSGSGDFVVNLLPPGQYTVTVEAPAFKKFVANVTLVAGDRARTDAQLQVGDATQIVEVNAITPALQTDSSTLRDTVSAAAVQDLPLNGRNYIQLVATAPGATAVPQTGSPAARGPTSAGRRHRSWPMG